MVLIGTRLQICLNCCIDLLLKAGGRLTTEFRKVTNSTGGPAIVNCVTLCTVFLEFISQAATFTLHSINLCLSCRIIRASVDLVFLNFFLDWSDDSYVKKERDIRHM